MVPRLSEEWIRKLGQKSCFPQRHFPSIGKPQQGQAFPMQWVEMGVGHMNTGAIFNDCCHILSWSFLAQYSIFQCKLSLIERGLEPVEVLFDAVTSLLRILAIRSRHRRDSNLVAGSHTGTLDFSTPKNPAVSRSNWPLTGEGVKEVSDQFWV